MALKKFKPITPGQRGLVLLDRSGLWKGRPEKSLTVGLKKTGGRNNQGRITVRHIGGGSKKKYRLIDFKRRKLDVEAKVLRLEYDPCRTAFISLIEYKDGCKSYIIAPQKLTVGSFIVSSANQVDIKVGNATKLKNIPVGTVIHNIELKPGKGAQVARSAGSYAQLIGKDKGYVQIRLSSGELRLVKEDCFAVIGTVSNSDNKNTNLGKAGRNRWLGVRPTVRGVAMNPVDHPHGGGEGKTSGGRHPVSPWGKPTKGKRTRKNKRTDNMIIKRRYQ